MLALGRALMGLPRLLAARRTCPLAWRRESSNPIFSILAELHRDGMSLLIVEQSVHAVLALAQRAYILEGGRIVGEGDGQSLLKDDHVRAAYLGSASARKIRVILTQQLILGLLGRRPLRPRGGRPLFDVRRSPCLERRPRRVADARGLRRILAVYPLADRSRLFLYSPSGRRCLFLGCSSTGRCFSLSSKPMKRFASKTRC